VPIYCGCGIWTETSLYYIYLERIGRLENFHLLKEIYNRIKVIVTIGYGKQYSMMVKAKIAIFLDYGLVFI
jgi:hypothetical protein